MSRVQIGTAGDTSLSSWRAWIEIFLCLGVLFCANSRSPHGERGLKYEILGGEFVGFGRSLSSWRAWIEMQRVLSSCVSVMGRSPHGERGLKSDSYSERNAG